MSQVNVRLSNSARNVLLSVFIALTMLAAPRAAQTAQAQVSGSFPAPPWPAACRAANGQPVVPVFQPGWNYAWSFIANFNQLPSTTTVEGCFTEAYLGSSGTNLYTRIIACNIVNNVAVPQRSLGGGTATFDGNLYVRCALPLLASHQADFFYVRARANLPNASANYSILTSTPANFSAKLDSSCQLTLRSTYVDATTQAARTFTNAATGNKCGAMIGIGSRIRNDSPNRNVSHLVDGITLSPVHTPSMKISIPMTYEIQIGAPGTIFTLDEFVIDPQPMKCCTGS
jgi:hypothetical protein